MSDGLERSMREAPDDVEATVRWLLELGFDETDARYTESAFGNVIITLAKDGDAVTIMRDRSQWMMDVRRAGWEKSFNLGIILDVIDDRDDWSQTLDELPLQLPPGVSWLEALPRAWSWAEPTADVEAVIERKQRQRARSLLPAPSRKRK